MTTSPPDPSNLRAFLLKPTFAGRVWGRTDLQPWYMETGVAGPVGEAWLTGPECVAAGGEYAGQPLQTIVPGFSLLVKLLFPADKLSVQVHPDDAEARVLGLERGKTECWYVLEAEPGATVACGLKPGTTVEDVEAAITAGTLESKLRFLPVAAGDMVLIDAGTVHAIGPGVTLLEVQQCCDTTYRLYDYGRDRELHLKEGLKVIKTNTAAGKVDPDQKEGHVRLVENEYFVLDRFDLEPGTAFEMEMDGIGCVVGIAGAGAVNEVRFRTGEAVIVPDGSVTMTSAAGCTFVRCSVPAAT